jgi:hypothetical protein
MIDLYDYGKLWYYVELRVDMWHLLRQVTPQTKQAHTATSFYASRQGK